MPWPDTAAREVLNNSLTQLASSFFIDPELSSMVENLYQSQLVNDHQKETIYSGRTNLHRVGNLLDYLSNRGTTDAFVSFVNILGSDDGENLPELRQELITKYANAGGDLRIFGASEQASGDIPPLSCTESASRVTYTINKFEKKSPGTIRDVMVSMFMGKANVFCLMDFNQCCRFVLHHENQVSDQKERKHSPIEDTAESLLLLRPQRMVLLWPTKIRFVDVSFDHPDEEMKPDESYIETPGTAGINCQAVVKDDMIAIGDQNGHVTLFNSQSSLQPPLVLPGPIAGVVVAKLDEDYTLLAWTQSGHRVIATVTAGRFENICESRTNLHSGSKLLACAGDFRKDYVECIQTSNGEIALSTFDKGQPKLQNQILSRDEDHCLHLVVDDGECVAATVERFVYLRHHTRICLLDLNLQDQGIECLRVQRIARGHFLVVATRNNDCFFLTIRPSSR